MADLLTEDDRLLLALATSQGCFGIIKARLDPWLTWDRLTAFYGAPQDRLEQLMHLDWLEQDLAQQNVAAGLRRHK